MSEKLASRKEKKRSVAFRLEEKEKVDKICDVKGQDQGGGNNRATPKIGEKERRNKPNPRRVSSNYLKWRGGGTKSLTGINIQSSLLFRRGKKGGGGILAPLLLTTENNKQACALKNASRASTSSGREY